MKTTDPTRAPRFRSFPKNMPMFHKRQYIKTLRDIRFNEKHGINEGYTKHLRYSNHLLIALYLAP